MLCGLGGSKSGEVEINRFNGFFVDFDLVDSRWTKFLLTLHREHTKTPYSISQGCENDFTGIRKHFYKDTKIYQEYGNCTEIYRKAG